MQGPINKIAIPPGHRCHRRHWSHVSSCGRSEEAQS